MEQPGNGAVLAGDERFTVGGFEGLMKDFQPFHSAFQIDNFIVGSGGTTWGKYLQALRELHARHQAIRERRAQQSEALLALETAEKSRDRLGVERARIKFEGTSAVIDPLCEEFMRFLAHAHSLRNQLGELTPERKEELESDLWSWRCRRSIAKDLFLRGAVSPSTLDMILRLPSEQRERVRDELRDDPKGLMDSLWEDDDIKPPPRLPECSEILDMIGGGL